MKKIIVPPCVVLSLVGLPLVVGMVGCSSAGPFGTFDVDVVHVRATQPVVEPSEPTPGVWIDTNIKVNGYFSGTVRSRLPYSAGIDFTDEKRRFEAVEFTRIDVTYDDGKADPNAKPPKLPLRIGGREFTSYNSVAGGKVVKSELWGIHGRIPGVVTRNESFTLRIEGHFLEKDGTKRPFSIDQHYDVEREKAVTPALELYKGV